MGYTVYWHRPKKVSDDVMGSALIDFMELLYHDVFDFDLVGPVGEGDVIVDDDYIAFNGTRKEGACESFNFPADISGDRFLQEVDDGLYLEFAKTRRLPYDLAVKTILLIFKQYLGDDLVIASDGFVEDEEGNTNFEKAEQIIEEYL